MDLLNEGSVLVVGYIFLAYTSLIRDNNCKRELGSLAITIVFLNMIGNVLLSAYIILK